MIDPNNQVAMASTDGSKKIVPEYLREEMIKRGWKVLINPPKGVEYFPELDQGSKYYQKNQQSMVQESDVLEVTVL